MSKIVKIFNELIKIKLSPQFGEVLLDCKLIGREHGFGVYRYDLLFIFDSEYNNPAIQLESVLLTCDELFNWVDLTVFTNLSIVIMHKFGRNQHYSYFELMDALYKRNDYIVPMHVHKHPKYQQYLEWKDYDKREKLRRQDYERSILAQQRRFDETPNTIDKKRKTFNWW
jgi:hypothetical protein